MTQRRPRSALTALAVTLGVANVVAALVVNATIDRGVQRRATFFGGGADAIARPAPGADVGIARGDVERLQRLRHVRISTAVLGFDAASPSELGHSIFLIEAIDDAGRAEVIADRLVEGRVFRLGQTEIVLSQSAARAFRLSIGDQWRTDLSQFDIDDPMAPPFQRLVPGAPRIQRFTVTGIVEDPPGEPSGPHSGSYISLEYAWRIFEQDVAGEVRFFLDANIDPVRWVEEVETGFPKLRFESSAATPELRRLLRTMQGLLAGSSALALFVGAFLIYLTFSITIVERTRLYGSLHAIGAEGRQVAWAVIVEALIVGVVASVLGLVLGLVLSTGLLRLVTRAVPLLLDRPAFTPTALAAGVAVGLSATAVGVAVPAIGAARMSPVAAIRGVAAPIRRPSLAWVGGLALIAAGVAFSLSRSVGANIASSLAALAVLLGAVLIVPVTLGVLTRLTRRVATLLTPGLGHVAEKHVTREPSRSAYTLALVMVVLAAVLTLGTTDRSLGNVLDRWLDKRFGADLLIYGPGITPELRDRIANLQGISKVTGIDFGRRVGIIRHAVHRSQNLILIDPHTFFDIAGFPWAEGTDDAAHQALARGGSVLMPARLAQDLELGRGDSIELAIGDKRKRFAVAGVYATFSEGPEVGVVASFADENFFGSDETRNAIYLTYAAGASAQSVRRGLESLLLEPLNYGRQPVVLFGPGQSIGSYYVTTASQVKNQARGDLHAFLRMFVVVVMIAVIVAVLGMANTLAATVLLRFREIGILQATGAAPRDVRRMIVAESALLTAVAFLLSLGLGGLLSWMFAKGASLDIGFTIDLVFPWRLLALLALLAGAIAVVAAATPSRRAERLTPVQALRYE